MRPIDADTLYANIGHRHMFSGESVGGFINNSPTIDAIPVGWLIDRANDPERTPPYRHYAQMLYEEWRKEQEGK